MSNTGAINEIDPNTIQGYDLLRASCGYFPVAGYSVLEMRGEDRKGWLQGQCTNDVRQFTAGSSIAFCICSPTGHMLADCNAWALPDRFLIVTSTPCVPALLERADTMVILEDVQLLDVSAEFLHLSVQGPGATSEIGRHIDLPALDAGLGPKGEILLRNNRTGYGGWDVLLPAKGQNKLKSELTKLDLVPEEAVQIARLEAGIPLFGIDMNEKTLPPEMGEDFVAKHINYRKGCYTGQEVIMRIHSRGHTNRTWVGLILDAPVKPGAVVSHSSREDAGVVTSVAESPHFGSIAAAMVRRETAFDHEEVRVGAVGGEVAIMPILRFGA